jgi:hypothetical protein
MSEGPVIGGPLLVPSRPHIEGFACPRLGTRLGLVKGVSSRPVVLLQSWRPGTDTRVGCSDWRRGSDARRGVAVRRIPLDPFRSLVRLPHRVDDTDGSVAASSSTSVRDRARLRVALQEGGCATPVPAGPGRGSADVGHGRRRRGRVTASAPGVCPAG